jgi:hypothetical protein
MPIADMLINNASGHRVISFLDGWRTSLVHYLENLGHIDNRKVRRQALKYVMLDNTLYHRTIDGVLLKCLGLD